MDDRELLEKAAKAADLDVHPGNGWQSDMLFMRFARPDGLWTAREWNPLTDDGDAFRLAVKLQIDLVHFSGHLRADARGLPDTHQMHDGDPYAATRRAIVRAAAAMAPESDARDPSTGGA